MPSVMLCLLLALTLPSAGSRIPAAAPQTALVAAPVPAPSEAASPGAPASSPGPERPLPPAPVPARSASPGPATSPQQGSAASPAVGNGPKTAPSAKPALRDRAQNLVGGVWQCETIAGSTGTHTYTAGEYDDSIELEISLHSGSRTFDITEVYRFDGTRNGWTVETSGGTYRGTAAPWTGEKWIFDGTEKTSGQRRPVRMVYTELGGQAFRRDFQAEQDGFWRTYSAETCKRPSV